MCNCWRGSDRPAGLSGKAVLPAALRAEHRIVEVFLFVLTADFMAADRTGKREGDGGCHGRLYRLVAAESAGLNERLGVDPSAVAEDDPTEDFGDFDPAPLDGRMPRGVETLARMHQFDRVGQPRFVAVLS